MHDCFAVCEPTSASPRIAIWPVGTGNDIDRGLRLTKNSTPTEPNTAANHRPWLAPSIDSFIGGGISAPSMWAFRDAEPRYPS